MPRPSSAGQEFKGLALVSDKALAGRLHRTGSPGSIACPRNYRCTLDESEPVSTPESVL